MYKEYLAEFWYSAKALENSKVSFSIPTGGIYEEVAVNTFRNSIGAHYLPHSSEYVAPPSIDTVRPWVETIRYTEIVPAKGTLKKSLLPPSLANGINIDYARKGASYSAKQVEEEEEASRTIKLEDLAKLVSNVQSSFKDLDLPKDDPIIVVDDSDEDEDAEKDESVPKSLFLRSSQIQELTNQAKLKTLDALLSLLNKVINALIQFAQAIASKKTKDESIPSTAQAGTQPAKGEKNTNQTTISQLFQRKAATNANLTKQQSKPTPPPTTPIIPPAPLNKLNDLVNKKRKHADDIHDYFKANKRLKSSVLYEAHPAGTILNEPVLAGIIVTDFINVKGCILIGWDDVVSGRMVESENFSPQQPPRVHPGHGLMVLKRCVNRSTLHPFMNALERDMIGCNRSGQNIRNSFIKEGYKIRRQGHGISGNVIPLFETMMVNAQEEVGEEIKLKRKQGQATEFHSPSSEIPVKESIPTPFNDTLPSGEDIIQLNELMIFCTNLQQQVLDLEEAKNAQAKEIANLKKIVKKLKKGERECIQTGRSIEDIDQDAEIALVDEAQKRIHDADMFGVDDLKGNEVIVDVKEKIIEKEVNTADPITTAGEVVTAASVEDSATPTTTTTIDIDDELTLAKTLITIKAAKPKVISTAVATAITKPRAKGVVFHEKVQAHIPTVSSSKDKGKAKMIEPEKPLKKKDQIALDEELARKLEVEMKAEMKEEERIAREKDEANRAVIKE
uniref:Uncharacterized protein n=1 Tax=Tanacetum cinerariifolium TaxID=118510 RepID=A0A6L2KPD4_TANCI|nr:hypothetical protein [Tanacetum cinerariifolium]